MDNMFSGGGAFGHNGFLAVPIATLGQNETQPPPNGDAVILPMPNETPEQIRGKQRISVLEAQDLLAALDVVLAPITSEEREAHLEDNACLREFSAGNFPIVERLRTRLQAFLATNPAPEMTFELSKGEVNVTTKAVDCALSIGRAEALKTALTVGGIGAGAVLLLILL